MKIIAVSSIENYVNAYNILFFLCNHIIYRGIAVKHVEI